jgi:predicted RNase H-like HicB family nuclease
VKTYSFRAELQQEEDNRWSAWISALPGCAAWGDSREEALDALRDAAEAYLADMLDAHEDISSKASAPSEGPLLTVTV